MRIALLTWESLHSVAVGGVAVHVTELAAALDRKGNEVHVFTRMRWPGDWHYDRIDGVHYHRVPYSGRADIVDDMNEMCRSFVTAVFQTEDYMGAAFDIVHAHDWMASNAMVWIKQGRGRKGILTCIPPNTVAAAITFTVADRSASWITSGMALIAPTALSLSHGRSSMKPCGSTMCRTGRHA